MKNLNTAFPFMDRLDEQVRFKELVDVVPYIICEQARLVPWIIRRPHSTGVIGQISTFFYPLNGDSPLEVHGDDFGITIVSGSVYDYLVYTGTDLPSLIPIVFGGYYLTVVDSASSKTWYSETFVVRATVTEYFKITYSNLKQISGIMLAFEQKIYLDKFFKAPEYPREDQGEKRDGVLVKEKQILMKSNSLHLPQIPEYLVDALMLLPMMDSVTVTFNSENYTFDEIRVKDPEWSDPAYAVFAKLDLTFISDVVVKKLNFKESNYTGGDMGILKTGGPVLTTAVGRYFEYQVVFDEDMPSADYKPDAVATSTGEMVNGEHPSYGNITIHGFTIRTTIACEVRWSAAYNPE